MGEVAGCIADADVWRPLIDEHVLAMHADVLGEVHSTKPLLKGEHFAVV